MIAEARAFADRTEMVDSLRLGAATGLRPIPAWKQGADFLLTQVSYSIEELLRWRNSVSFDGPIYAGVMVLPSPSMARKLSADVPQLAVPEVIIEQLDRDRGSGVDIACDHIEAIHDSEAFDGIHLIPVNRYREMAARLESLLR